MDKVRNFIAAATGDALWAVILIPILAISWLGFYTIARDVGIPPLFAGGMSAAFDGVALFAARIGLKHRRKGFSGYLARITVVAFAALGAFVQSFHAESQPWIHAHSWIVWATAPVAACLAYELHLGWVHRKQLIAKGYTHPSAKSGFGPATWMHFPGETLHEYRDVLRARRAYIAKSNLARFELEEAEQVVQPKAPKMHKAPKLPIPTPTPNIHLVPNPKAKSKKHARTTPRPASRPAAKPVAKTNAVKAWAVEQGYELGYNGRVPIEVLRAYRAAVDVSARVG